MILATRASFDVGTATGTGVPYAEMGRRPPKAVVADVEVWSVAVGGGDGGEHELVAGRLLPPAARSRCRGELPFHLVQCVRPRQCRTASAGSGTQTTAYSARTWQRGVVSGVGDSAVVAHVR